MLDKVFRSVITTVVVVVLIVFGSSLRPGQKVGQASIIDQIMMLGKTPPSIAVGRWDEAKEVRMNGSTISVRKGKIDRAQMSNAWSKMEKKIEETMAGGKDEGFLAGLRVDRSDFVRMRKRGWNPSDFISAFLVLDDGKGKYAEVFSFSSSGLSLENFLPGENGDAPGEDIEGVPRVPLSRRVLSIHRETPSPGLSIVAYEYQGSAAQAKLFYSNQLTRNGWEELRDGTGERTFVFRKKDRLLSVDVSADPNGGVSVVVALAGD